MSKFKYESGTKYELAIYLARDPRDLFQPLAIE